MLVERFKEKPKSAEAAERFSAENPSYSFLTPEGTCYQGRAVTGGRPSDAGPLVMKRELRNLEVEGLRLENESNELRSALEAIVADFTTAKQAFLDRYDEAIRQSHRSRTRCRFALPAPLSRPMFRIPIST